MRKEIRLRIAKKVLDDTLANHAKLEKLKEKYADNSSRLITLATMLGTSNRQIERAKKQLEALIASKDTDEEDESSSA